MMVKITADFASFPRFAEAPKGHNTPFDAILIMIITESPVKCNNNFDESDNSFVIIIQLEN